MTSIDERLDALMAYAMAHRAVLQQLSSRSIPALARNATCRMACDDFEQAYSAINGNERSHQLIQKAIAEIELILRDPTIRPVSDGLGKK